MPRFRVIPLGEGFHERLSKNGAADLRTILAEVTKLLIDSQAIKKDPQHLAAKCDFDAVNVESYSCQLYSLLVMAKSAGSLQNDSVSSSLYGSHSS